MDDVANAIADPVRRRIVELLRDRSLPAGEIAREFPISRPAVSRHLRVLRESGLVIDAVEGRRRLYRLNLAPLAPLRAWVAELHAPWETRLDALETEVYRTRRERRASPAQPEEQSA